MSREDRRATAAYGLLIVATLLSFWAAEHVVDRTIAVAGIMTIAAIKVLTVLKRFMELDRTPLGLRAYFHAWSIGYAAMIFGAAWFAGR